MIKASGQEPSALLLKCLCASRRPTFDPFLPPRPAVINLIGIKVKTGRKINVSPWPSVSLRRTWCSSSTCVLIPLMRHCNGNHMGARRRGPRSGKKRSSRLFHVDPSCASSNSSAQDFCHLRPFFFFPPQTHPLVQNQPGVKHGRNSSLRPLGPGHKR